MIKLFTDSDLDGISCGLLAKLAFGDNVDIVYCSYRTLNERVRQFIDNSLHDEQLYITDLSVNEAIEKKLAERFQAGKHVQMIDHHVTALHFNRYPWGSVQPVDEHGKKTCATSLFYEYLVQKQCLARTETLDAFVELVRQYDTWDWEENKTIEAKRLNDLLGILGMDEFIEQMLERLQAKLPFSFTDMEQYIFQAEEKKLERYIRLKQKQLVQTWMDGHCVGIVFAEQHISELGNALAKRFPHLDLIALVNVGTKHIGFRTIHDEVDVSAFAKKFGGGGHPKASGCLMDEQMFSRFVVAAFQLPPVYRDAEQNRYNTKTNDQGILFKNNEDQWFLLTNEKERTWKVLSGGPAVSFKSSDEAERWIKRQFAAGLADDALVFEHLQQQLSWPKETIAQRYEEAIRKYKSKKS